MKNFLIDFHSRVQQIELYFRFVAEIDKVETDNKQEAILFPDQSQYVVDSDLKKF